MAVEPTSSMMKLRELPEMQRFHSRRSSSKNLGLGFRVEPMGIEPIIATNGKSFETSNICRNLRMTFVPFGSSEVLVGNKTLTESLD